MFSMLHALQATLVWWERPEEPWILNSIVQRLFFGWHKRQRLGSFQAFTSSPCASVRPGIKIVFVTGARQTELSFTQRCCAVPTVLELR